MRFEKLKKLVTVSLFTAIICASTFVVRIPTPAVNGYLNLGDCFSLLAGLFLGPGRGALASGLGSALADVLSAYPQYAPGTFVIKGLTAPAAYFARKGFKKAFNGKYSFLSKLAGGICAETIMVLGYFGYEAVFLKYGAAAVGAVPANAAQGVVGAVAAAAVASAVERSETLMKIFRKER